MHNLSEKLFFFSTLWSSMPANFVLIFCFKKTAVALANVNLKII